MARRIRWASRKLSPTILARLMTLYRQSSGDSRLIGMDWYRCAFRLTETMALDTGLSHSLIVGVLAAISPGLEWGLNVSQTKELIEAWKNGLRGKYLPRVGVYGRPNRKKAIKILKGANPLDVLSGPKVIAFYQNILHPNSAHYVTIDRHARSAALGRMVEGPDHTGEYEWIAHHYQKGAEMVGLLPNQFQAILWMEWKRLKEDKNAR